MIYHEVRAKMTEARKAKLSDEIVVLSTILGNLDLVATMVNGAKVVSDDDAVKRLKSLHTNLKELVAAQGTVTDKQKYELELLESLIPSQMDENAIVAVIKANSFGNMGEFMKYMKANHLNLYDGALASKVFKEQNV